MGELDVERRLTETESRSKSNKTRIDEVEKRQDNLDKLVTSVEVLATRMNSLESTMAEVRTDVRRLNEKPARKWDSIVDKILTLVVAAIVAYMLSKIGL